MSFLKSKSGMLLIPCWKSFSCSLVRDTNLAALPAGKRLSLHTSLLVTPNPTCPYIHILWSGGIKLCAVSQTYLYRCYSLSQESLLIDGYLPAGPSRVKSWVKSQKDWPRIFFLPLITKPKCWFLGIPWSLLLYVVHEHLPY